MKEKRQIFKCIICFESLHSPCLEQGNRDTGQEPGLRKMKSQHGIIVLAQGENTCEVTGRDQIETLTGSFQTLLSFWPDFGDKSWKEVGVSLVLMSPRASANKPWMKISLLELIPTTDERVCALERGKPDCWCRSMSLTAVTSLIKRWECRRGLVLVKHVCAVFDSFNNVYTLMGKTFAEKTALENCVRAGQVKKTNKKNPFKLLSDNC